MLMTPEIQQTMLYSLMNAPVRDYPFPHFYVEKLFPDGFARELLTQLPDTEAYRGIYSTGRISNPNNQKETRYVFSLRDHLSHLSGKQAEFWKSVADYMLSEAFALTMIRKFLPALQQRFPQGMPQAQIQPYAELFRDVTDYLIGPHTDHPSRLLNFFIYLPQDDKHPELGTSFYVPKTPGQTCEGGPHHAAEGFINVFTAPYLPNSAAGFFKNNTSFHGVEPIVLPNFTRNVLGYYIKLAS